MPMCKVSLSDSISSSSTCSNYDTDETQVSTLSITPTGRLVSPNWWWKYRQIIREAAAEFTGTMILIIFGTGVVNQVMLSSNTEVSSSPKGEYLSISFGWAAGTALGAWVGLGISGGHINPAVTLALATWRGFPWKKVPGYILAQLLGGFAGAALIYGDYIHLINVHEGGTHVRTMKTATMFATYAAEHMSNLACFFSEFFATAILVIVVLATGDKSNGAPPPGMVPLVLFILILGLGACLGMPTGYAINPARDFGPRLLTYMIGCGSSVFTYRHQYWLWCPIIAPIIGAQAGAMFYDVLLFNGKESIVNRPDAAARQRIANGDELV